MLKIIKIFNNRGLQRDEQFGNIIKRIITSLSNLKHLLVPFVSSSNSENLIVTCYQHEAASGVYHVAEAHPPLVLGLIPPHFSADNILLLHQLARILSSWEQHNIDLSAKTTQLKSFDLFITQEMLKTSLFFKWIALEKTI